MKRKPPRHAIHRKREQALLLVEGAGGDFRGVRVHGDRRYAAHSGQVVEMRAERRLVDGQVLLERQEARRDHTLWFERNPLHDAAFRYSVVGSRMYKAVPSPAQFTLVYGADRVGASLAAICTGHVVHSHIRSLDLRAMARIAHGLAPEASTAGPCTGRRD